MIFGWRQSRENISATIRIQDEILELLKGKILVNRKEAETVAKEVTDRIRELIKENEQLRAKVKNLEDELHDPYRVVPRRP